MMERAETGATPMAKPAVGPTLLPTRSAERAADFSPRGLKSAAHPATPARPDSRRADATRTATPTAGETQRGKISAVSPGPRRSTRKRRPREPQRAGGEAITQIARVIQSRGTVSASPPAPEPDDLQGYSLNNLSILELRRAVVLREVLDPPLALRKPDAGRW